MLGCFVSYYFQATVPWGNVLFVHELPSNRVKGLPAHSMREFSIWLLFLWESSVSSAIAGGEITVWLNEVGSNFIIGFLLLNFNRANYQIRTDDPFITNEMLYQTELSWRWGTKISNQSTRSKSMDDGLFLSPDHRINLNSITFVLKFKL